MADETAVILEVTFHNSLVYHHHLFDIAARQRKVVFIKATRLDSPEKIGSSFSCLCSPLDGPLPDQSLGWVTTPVSGIIKRQVVFSNPTCDW